MNKTWKLLTLFAVCTTATHPLKPPQNWQRDWRTYAAGTSLAGSLSFLAGIGITEHKLRKARKQYNTALCRIFTGTEELKKRASESLPQLEARVHHLEKVRQGLIAPLVLAFLGAGGLTASMYRWPKADAAPPKESTPRASSEITTNQNGKHVVGKHQSTSALPPPEITPGPRTMQSIEPSPASRPDMQISLAGIKKYITETYEPTLPKIWGRCNRNTQLHVCRNSPTLQDIMHIFYNINRVVNFPFTPTTTHKAVIKAACELKGIVLSDDQVKTEIQKKQKLSEKDHRLLTDSVENRALWFIQNWPKATQTDQVAALKTLESLSGAHLTLTD